MTVVNDTIAIEIAALERLRDPPVEPFGYGTDIAMSNDGVDLDARMSDTQPFSTRTLGEALVRRLDCPRGQLADDGSYGIDIRSKLNKGSTDTEIRTLAGQIRNELEKDDRVSSLTVTVRPTATGDRLDIEIAVVPVDPNLGDFELILALTSAELLLEEIRTI